MLTNVVKPMYFLKTFSRRRGVKLEAFFAPDRPSRPAPFRPGSLDTFYVLFGPTGWSKWIPNGFRNAPRTEPKTDQNLELKMCQNGCQNGAKMASKWASKRTQDGPRAPLGLPWGVSSPLPGYWHTILRAELHALFVFLQHPCLPFCIAIDNLTVIMGLSWGKRWCCAPRRAHTDLWRAIWFN